MKYLAVIIILLFVSVSPVMGDAITGVQFMQRCSAVGKVNRVPVSEEETVYATFCLGYITGFIDHYELLAKENNLQNKTFCFSNNNGPVTNTQLVEIVLHYLKINPEKQKLNINKAISLALKDAFPCRSTPN